MDKDRGTCLFAKDVEDVNDVRPALLAWHRRDNFDARFGRNSCLRFALIGNLFIDRDCTCSVDLIAQVCSNSSSRYVGLLVSNGMRRSAGVYDMDRRYATSQVGSDCADFVYFCDSLRFCDIHVNLLTART